MMNKISFLLFLLCLIACGKSHDMAVSKNAQDYPQNDELNAFMIKKLNGKIGWDNQINYLLSEELEQDRYANVFNVELDASDLNLLGCNNYNELTVAEKKLFIIVFLAAIAERESDFDPNNMTYDPTHKNWNIGLMQIDTKSALRHANEILSEEQLKDSFLNLKVAISIYQNQITGKYRQDLMGKLFTGKSFYWEVLNDNYKHRVIKSFLNNRRNLPFCKI